MEFPYAPAHVHHKAGGKITLITGISHTCDKPEDGRSRDYWYFTGNIEWRDGGKSKNAQIPPYSVCYSDDAGKPAVDMLMDALNEYLLANGEWFHGKGKHEGWCANNRPQASKRRAA